MIAATGKVAVLTSSETLSSVMHMRIADISSNDYLITELVPDSHELQAYRSQNITLL